MKTKNKNNRFLCRKKNHTFGYINILNFHTKKYYLYNKYLKYKWKTMNLLCKKCLTCQQLIIKQQRIWPDWHRHLKNINWLVYLENDYSLTYNLKSHELKHWYVNYQPISLKLIRVFITPNLSPSVVTTPITMEMGNNTKKIMTFK